MNRKLKMLIAVMLLAAMTLTNLSTIGQAETERTVIKWMVWGSPEQLEQRINILYELYPEYKDKYDIQAIVGGKDDNEVLQKLRLALSANTDVPDIVHFNYGMMPGFADMGVLADITDFMEPYKTALVPGGLKMVTYKDRVVGFPVNFKTKLWFYRQDMFEAAGIVVEDIKTEDDFVNAGKKLQEVYPNAFIWNIGPQIASYNLAMVLSGNGGRFADEAGNYIVSTDPGVRKAFEFFKRIKEEGIVLNASDFTPDWEQAFANDVLASTLISSWFAGDSYLPKYAPHQIGKWAVTQWPAVADSFGGSESGGSLSCIMEKSQNKEAALDILSKITFDNEIRMRIYNIQPVHLPLSTEGFSNPAITIPHPYFGESLITAREESLSSDMFALYPYNPASGFEFKLMNQYLDIYLNGNESLDIVLENAEKDLREQIGNPLDYAN